jgi:hypothetical protein
VPNSAPQPMGCRVQVGRSWATTPSAAGC